MRKAALFPDEANHIPDVLGQETGCVCPRLGTSPPVSCPFPARLPRMQAELHCPQHCGKSSTRSSDGGVPHDTGQQTGGSVPSLGHVHPVNLSLHPVDLSLPDQPARDSPTGCVCPRLGTPPSVSCPFPRTVASHAGRTSLSTALWKIKHPLIGRRGSLRYGTTDRGKCPKSGTRSPGQFVPSPGQFVPSPRSICPLFSIWYETCTLIGLIEKKNGL